MFRQVDHPFYFEPVPLERAHVPACRKKVEAGPDVFLIEDDPDLEIMWNPAVGDHHAVVQVAATFFDAPADVSQIWLESARSDVANHARGGDVIEDAPLFAVITLIDFPALRVELREHLSPFPR